MEEKKLYIEREDPEGTLYERLQRSSLEALQRLSGEVWTDYNPGDPGVTTADIANYALTELDYKLGFSLRDYLTDGEGVFAPEKYGLFMPESVYPTTPVTAEDYCKSMLAEFPEIDNLEVQVKDASAGQYSVTVYPSPFVVDEAALRTLRSRIFSYFHSHRNLCENLREEDIVIHGTPSPEDELSLFSEVELEDGADPVSVLTQLYWKTMRYLAGSVEIRRLDPTFQVGKVSLETWMDGTGRNTGVDLPRQENTQQELFALLRGTEGVKAFKTCYFVHGNTAGEASDEERKIASSFSSRNRLYIPDSRRELKVRLFSGGTELPVDMTRFHDSLQALFFSRKDRPRKEGQGEEGCDFSHALLKPGTYRDIWNHAPLSGDFPAIYRSEMKRGRSPEGLQGSFEAYLELFDRLMERGLSETRQLKDLLSIEAPQHTSVRILRDGDSDDVTGERDVFALKSRYMDFLDDLYGVQSNPDKVVGLAWYGGTEQEELERRARFLRHVPELTECRSKSYDIFGAMDGENVPVIKKHLSLLFNLDMDESVQVGSILPSVKLTLLEGDVNHTRIPVTWVTERIPLCEPELSADEKEARYSEMRRELQQFRDNKISESLFRGGIDIRHYLVAATGGAEFLLIFRDEEQTIWLEVGRSRNKKRLMELANLLRLYLLELNRRCEAVYVLEHNLFVPSGSVAGGAFRVSFVLPDWTSRFHSEQFIQSLKRAVSRLLPAHIGYEICRLGPERMPYFESAYGAWRRALARRAPEAELRECQDAMLAELSRTRR